jgi:hypothetical protein
MTLTGIDLRGIVDHHGDRTSAVKQLSKLAIAAVPQSAHGAIATIDSPRWPCDLDWSTSAVTFRECEMRGRLIDAGLQHIAKELRRTGATNLKLSMFPTPRLAYFLGQIAHPSCKPHLRKLGRELFGEPARDADRSGGSFTRFMLSGFAAYRALGALRVTCYEGYPDLQFRLWSDDFSIPSKMRSLRGKLEALGERCRIIERLAQRLRINGSERVRTIDQADAAVLVLSLAAEHSGDRGLVVEHPAEGRFRVTIPAASAELLSFHDD